MIVYVIHDYNILVEFKNIILSKTIWSINSIGIGLK